MFLVRSMYLVNIALPGPECWTDHDGDHPPTRRSERCQNKSVKVLQRGQTVEMFSFHDCGQTRRLGSGSRLTMQRWHRPPPRRLIRLKARCLRRMPGLITLISSATLSTWMSVCVCTRVWEAYLCKVSCRRTAFRRSSWWRRGRRRGCVNATLIKKCEPKQDRDKLTELVTVTGWTSNVGGALIKHSTRNLCNLRLIRCVEIEI